MIYACLQFVLLAERARRLHKEIKAARQFEICRREIIVEDILIEAFAFGIVGKEVHSVNENVFDGLMDGIEIKQQHSGIEVVTLLDATRGYDVLTLDHMSEGGIDLGNGGKRFALELYKPKIGDIHVDQNISIEINDPVDIMSGHQLCHEQTIEGADAEPALGDLGDLLDKELQPLGHER